MIDALGTATAGMLDDMVRLNVISHNLANSTTAGFKRELHVSRPFLEFLRTSAPGSGTSLSAVPLPQAESLMDYRTGALKFSANPLDIAIENDSFFEVMTDQGPAYTRQGSFRLDAGGRLVTEQGLPVMGIGGEIMLATSQPTISGTGSFTENGREVGKLKLVRFRNVQTLQSIGNGLYKPAVGSDSTVDDFAKIRQGYVEASNVNSMEEMVRLIETMRHFETSQRLVQGYGDMIDKAINTLGQF